MAVDTARIEVEAKIAQVYEEESRRVFATLVRLLGDFDVAEDAMHDAFTAAIDQWTREGIPANPRAWLVSTGRFKAIDSMRRRARFDKSMVVLAEQMEESSGVYLELDGEGIEDDRLRLIFVCCDPILSPEARVALTLREVCGLTTEEIARAFLTAPSTLAQRIVRAKNKIRDEQIPFQVPPPADRAERLDTVLQVVYLVFNEGYSASSGETLMRTDLSAEAIRLGRLLISLLPETEAIGLLALMLLHESRRAARATEEGDLVLLEEQDRSLWNQAMIAEGNALVRRAIESGPVGPYSLQAAISAVHANAPSPQETDWAEIVALYDLLASAGPSPVIALNRAVAIAMRDGPEVALPLIDTILNGGRLADYHLVYAAKADLCRRLGRIEEARDAYRHAMKLTRQAPELRFFERRLRELDALANTPAPA